MTKGRPTFAIAAEVMEEAGRIFGVSPWRIVKQGNKRTASLARIRWAVIWTLRSLFYPDGEQAYTSTRIATILRYADHTTVLHGEAQAQALARRDPEYGGKVVQLFDFAARLWVGDGQ